MANHEKTSNDGVIDTGRISYLEQHFSAAIAAMENDVPLKGYFIWSLLDNFEWTLGYDKRFGLVHVDFNTFKRTPKSSFQALRNFLCD